MAEIPPGFKVVSEPPPIPAGFKLASAEEEKPGFLERSRQALTQGVSDALSTLSGDTYGRYGDPTAPDNLNAPQRLLKAAGGDVIPAAGDVAWDATVQAGKVMLPKSAENAIEKGAGELMSSIAQSETGQKLGQMKARLDEQYPGQMATAGELLNVGSVMLPKVKPKLKWGNKSGLEKSLKQARHDKVVRKLEPNFKDAQSNFEIQPGIMGARKYKPEGAEARMFDTVSDFDGFDPEKSFTDNLGKMDNEISRLKSKLDNQLEGKSPMPVEEVQTRLDDVQDNLARLPALQGDARQKSEALRAELSRLIDEVGGDGAITPRGVMEVRRKFDKWVDSNNVTIDPTSGTALQVAVRDMRGELNKLVAEKVPEAEVRELLSKQSDLLWARDIVRPRSFQEHRSRPGRWVANLEQKLGIRHPSTPQSLIITGQNPVVQGAAAVGLPLLLAGQVAGNQIKRESAGLSRTLAKLLNESPGAAQTGAILQLLNEDDE